MASVEEFQKIPAITPTTTMQGPFFSKVTDYLYKGSLPTCSSTNSFTINIEDSRNEYQTVLISVSACLIFIFMISSLLCIRSLYKSKCEKHKQRISSDNMTDSYASTEPMDSVYFEKTNYSSL